VTDLPSRSDWSAQPVVSSDGTRMAYVIDRTVKVRDMATGAERDVARCAPDILCSIAISPDGATVAFNPDPSSVALVDADGGIDEVADVILEHTMFVSVVGWTHDGERIVFISNMNREIDTDASLEAVSVDGADRTTILSARDFPDSIQTWWFDVSPRDSTIGWVQMNPVEDLTEGSEPDRDGQPFSLQLRMVDIDGSAQRVVADLGDCWCVGFSPDFTWSPDGLRYAYLVSSGTRVDNLLVASASEISDPTSIGSGNGEMIWFPDTA
jgi:Tol biopolymer transport system component